MVEEHSEAAGRVPVRIQLESVAAGERTVLELRGELSTRGAACYVRYQEPASAGMGSTTTTIRWQAGEVRVIRFGEVRFEQVFVQGKEHTGYMVTPHGRMELVTRTREVQVESSSSPALTYAVHWSYSLTVMGEDAGLYSLTLTVSPAA
ncbi:DUF1934 domain-containing protein [Paenibacillus sp. YYML68]|uniref:DUF1934 domain-containing protein n=1 Tax=Paenibacillus sp. YYML68 TaxID=2909250 RepID=UPI00248F9C12|nr:DUF1934 domain-containing protein [Paenibacillus sp. YYML68]